MSMPTTTKPASRAAEAESEKGSEILERLKSRLTKNAKAAEANTLTPLQIDALAELVCLMNSLQGPLIYLESGDAVSRPQFPVTPFDTDIGVEME